MTLSQHLISFSKQEYDSVSDKRKNNMQNHVAEMSRLCHSRMQCNRPFGALRRIFYFLISGLWRVSHNVFSNSPISRTYKRVHSVSLRVSHDSCHARARKQETRMWHTGGWPTPAATDGTHTPALPCDLIWAGRPPPTPQRNS